jgi:hypothetical protein
MRRYIMNTKNTVLYKELISKYFDCGTVDPEFLNAEKLVELCIAKEANLDWVGELNLPWDFECDKSDSKTTSIRKEDKSNGYTSFIGEISGTETKIGALRVVLYNPFANGCKGKVEYFYIPVDMVRVLEKDCYGKQSGKRKIKYTWNPAKDFYNSLEPFRCSTFEEMCAKI